LLLLSLLACPHAAAGAQRGRAAREQNVFGAELKIRRPTPLPGEVLRLLRADEDVRRRCLQQGGGDEAIRPELFVASRSHLAGAGPPALIVTSAKLNPCLGGTNIDTYWVFSLDPGGYRLLLKTNVLNLYVLKSRTKGLSDIRAQEATGVDVLYTIFKFDGNEYKVWRSWREPIKP
jgi:hypothetical protein